MPYLARDQRGAAFFSFFVISKRSSMDANLLSVNRTYLACNIIAWLVLILALELFKANGDKYFVLLTDVTQREAAD